MKSILFITIIFLMISTACAADTLIPTVSPSVDILGNGQVKVSGTAADTTNDANVTHGITRVEVKLDSGNWVTASGTTSFEYTFSDLSAGNHVIGVRSIDYSLNPSQVVYLDFVLDSNDVVIDDDDLSWYITIDDLHFETMTDINNVFTVPESSDVSINFEIENDHTQPCNVRWIVSKGSLEFKDNVQVRPGRSVKVTEWISGAYITEGTHRFTVTVIDWDTKETISEKSITLNVVPASRSSSSVDGEEIPEWFLVIAEQNGWSIPNNSNADISALQKSIESQNKAISDMQIAIADLKSQTSQTPQVPQTNVPVNTSNDEDDDWQYWAAGLAIIAYIKRDWIKEQMGSGKDEEGVKQVDPATGAQVFEGLRT